VDRFDAAVHRNLAAWSAASDPTATLALSYGDFPAAVAAGMNQMDALIHGWDLAAALGLTLQWPRDVAEAAMRTADVRFRTRPRGAAFGPAVPARDDTTQERLLALAGRDTSPWRAATLPSVCIKHVYAKLPAQDVQRARQFYEEKLGLSPFADVHGHLYYEVDGAHFLLFPSAGRPSGTHDQLGLVVGDLKAEMTRLGAAGVVFESYEPPDVPVPLHGNVMDMGAMKAAWIKDSEGNLLSLNEFVGASAFDR
jgi:catechol 2,3-dioxygenase-like lactoylglutathione lyase family enzyme